MKHISITLKICLTLMLLGYCSACSNHKVLKSENSSLEKAYDKINLPHHSYSTNSLLNIENSLSVFEQYDDAYGQWLANYYIANYWIYHNKLDTAKIYSQKSFRQAKRSQDPQALFKSTFQVAQLTEDSALLEQSLSYASNPIDRALVLTHLNKNQQAYDLIKNNLNKINAYQNNSIAFILFHYAQKNNFENIIKLSKQFYVKAENSNGVVDCLFWLAKNNFRKGNIDLANQFADRAKIASIALENRYKTIKIKLWIDRHL